jgi:hypothetical protein
MFISLKQLSSRSLNKLRLIVPVAAMFLASFASHALDLTGSIEVSPREADVGVERTIVVKGLWHNACPPVFRDVTVVPGDNPKLMLVNFDVLNTLVACAQVVTPFEKRFQYTPSHAGKLIVVASASDGREIASGEIQTYLDDLSDVDLSGMWADMSSPSGVLQISRSSVGDYVVGTLNVFGDDGASRWMILHSSEKRAEDTTDMVGDEFSATTPAPSPLCASRPCPGHSWSLSSSTMVRIQVLSRDRIVLRGYALPSPLPLHPVNGLIFSMRLARIVN